MTFDVDLSHVITLGLFLIAGLGATFWRLWAIIDKAKTEATRKAESVTAMALLSQTQLAEYKTHVAETYATKTGLNESLNRVHDALDRLTEKIDALLEGKALPTSRTRRSSGN